MGAKSIAALFFGALLSCGRPPSPIDLPLTVELSSKLTHEDRKLIQHAIDGWNEAVPGIVTQVKDADRASRRCGTAYVQYKAAEEAGLAQETDFDCYGVIRLPLRASDAPYQIVIIQHELGHAFGLTHSDDPNSVMFPRASARRYITPEDAMNAARMLEMR